MAVSKLPLLIVPVFYCIVKLLRPEELSNSNKCFKFAVFFPFLSWDLYLNGRSPVSSCDLVSSCRMGPFYCFKLKLIHVCVSAEHERAWRRTPPPYWKVTVVRTWHLAPDTSVSPPATAQPSPSVPSQNRLLHRRRRCRSPTTALLQSQACETTGDGERAEKSERN